MAEGARLESVYTFTGIGGSNPSLSASILNTIIKMLRPIYASAMRDRVASGDHQTLAVPVFIFLFMGSFKEALNESPKKHRERAK